MSVIQNKVRGGQRKKDKIVAYKVCTAYQTSKKPSDENTLLGSQILSMSVSDNDFAAVDSHEELC